MMFNSPSSTLLRQLSLTFMATIIALVLGAIYVIDAALGFNPIRLPLSKGAPASILMPQGWGFFTRDPKEPRVAYYQKLQGQWQPLLAQTNSNWSNAFGWSRSSDSDDLEINELFERAAKRIRWSPCAKALSLARCLQQARVTEVSKPKSVLWCSRTIGFSSQKPVPWAWAHAQDRIVMPRQVAVLRVTC
jgi:antimicrobial peptide system SdpA family protein